MNGITATAGQKSCCDLCNVNRDATHYRWQTANSLYNFTSRVLFARSTRLSFTVFFCLSFFSIQEFFSTHFFCTIQNGIRLKVVCFSGSEICSIFGVCVLSVFFHSLSLSSEYYIMWPNLWSVVQCVMKSNTWKRISLCIENETKKNSNLIHKQNLWNFDDSMTQHTTVLKKN